MMRTSSKTAIHADDVGAVNLFLRWPRRRNFLRSRLTGELALTDTTALARPRLNTRLTITVLSSLLLFVAFFLLPGTVARVWSSADGITTGNLAEKVGAAFSQWWLSAAAPLSPSMEAVVTFWEVFHVTKAVVAVALVIALLLTGEQVWRAYARTSGRASRAGIAVAGIVGAPLAPLMLLIVVANIAGAIAPLSSVMGLLPKDGSVPEVAQVLEQFAGGTTTPVLEALVSDFRVSHLVVVVAATIVAVVVVFADIALWIRWSRMPREEFLLRRVTATVAVVLPALAPLFLLLALINLSTVLDTAPALAAFYEGSF